MADLDELIERAADQVPHINHCINGRMGCICVDARSAVARSVLVAAGVPELLARVEKAEAEQQWFRAALENLVRSGQHAVDTLLAPAHTAEPQKSYDDRRDAGLTLKLDLGVARAALAGQEATERD